MQIISTPLAPPPAGHYSQAVVHQGTVYVAGLLPWDPQAPDGPLGDAAAQTRQVLENLRAVLSAAGSGLHRLLLVTVYVSRQDSWGEVDRVFREVLGEHRPARAVIPVAGLKRDAALEVVAVAAVGD